MKDRADFRNGVAYAMNMAEHMRVCTGALKSNDTPDYKLGWDEAIDAVMLVLGKRLKGEQHGD